MPYLFFWPDLLGEYVEKSILGMDKEEGSYYLKYLKKSLQSISIYFCLYSIVLAAYISLRTVRRQFRNEVWNMFEVRKFWQSTRSSRPYSILFWNSEPG